MSVLKFNSPLHKNGDLTRQWLLNKFFDINSEYLTEQGFTKGDGKITVVPESLVYAHDRIKGTIKVNWQEVPFEYDMPDITLAEIFTKFGLPKAKWVWDENLSGYVTRYYQHSLALNLAVEDQHVSMDTLTGFLKSRDFINPTREDILAAIETTPHPQWYLDYKREADHLTENQMSSVKTPLALAEMTLSDLETDDEYNYRELLQIDIDKTEDGKIHEAKLYLIIEEGRDPYKILAGKGDHQVETGVQRDGNVLSVALPPVEPILTEVSGSEEHPDHKEDIVTPTQPILIHVEGDILKPVVG